MQRVKPLGQLPKVWQHIEKKNKDGKLVKFTIQEIPEDRYEDAIQHMCTYFAANEPICQYFYSKNGPVFIPDMIKRWRLLLADGISIAAFVDNPDGGKPIIAGINILSVEVEDQKSHFSELQFKSENWKRTHEFISKAKKVVYESYKVDKCLYGSGLSVGPNYRGYGLGKDILKLRDLIGRTYGVSATAAAITSTFAQKSATSVGFEVLLTKNFADIVDENGKEYYPNINSKALKVMGKRFS